MTNRESRKHLVTTYRQEQILDAATEIFSQKGYAAATIPEIARLAGVAAGTIYIYYPSKRELFIAVLKKIILIVPLLNALEKMPAAGFPATVKEVLENRLNMISSTNIASMLSLMSDIQRDPELKAFITRELIRPTASQLEKFYAARMASGEFREFDPAIVARAVQGMLIGLTILNSLEGDTGPLNRLSRDKLGDELVDLLLNGLLKHDKKDGQGA